MGPRGGTVHRTELGCGSGNRFLSFSLSLTPRLNVANLHRLCASYFFLISFCFVTFTAAFLKNKVGNAEQLGCPEKLIPPPAIAEVLLTQQQKPRNQSTGIARNRPVVSAKSSDQTELFEVRRGPGPIWLQASVWQAHRYLESYRMDAFMGHPHCSFHCIHSVNVIRDPVSSLSPFWPSSVGKKGLPSLPCTSGTAKRKVLCPA